jgi:hypothetical protein
VSRCDEMEDGGSCSEPWRRLSWAETAQLLVLMSPGLSGHVIKLNSIEMIRLLFVP